MVTCRTPASQSLTRGFVFLHLLSSLEHGALPSLRIDRNNYVVMDGQFTESVCGQDVRAVASVRPKGGSCGRTTPNPPRQWRINFRGIVRCVKLRQHQMSKCTFR